MGERIAARGFDDEMQVRALDTGVNDPKVFVPTDDDRRVPQCSEHDVAPQAADSGEHTTGHVKRPTCGDANSLVVPDR
ncbi:MAG TPA: hypothetical protein VGG28_16600, partial [Kofleriaceae bacterium]